MTAGCWTRGRQRRPAPPRDEARERRDDDRSRGGAVERLARLAGDDPDRQAVPDEPGRLCGPVDLARDQADLVVDGGVVGAAPSASTFAGNEPEREPAEAADHVDADPAALAPARPPALQSGLTLSSSGRIENRCVPATKVTGTSCERRRSCCSSSASRRGGAQAADVDAGDLRAGRERARRARRRRGRSRARRRRAPASERGQPEMAVADRRRAPGERGQADVEARALKIARILSARARG